MLQRFTGSNPVTTITLKTHFIILKMTTVFFSLVSLVAALSVCIICTSELGEQLGPGFELSQSIGPIYIDYDPSINYKKFLQQTTGNTYFWYVNGYWGLDAPLSAYYPNSMIPPKVAGWSSIEGDVIKSLYTGNYMYPLLTNQPLPLAKTFLGNFDLDYGASIILDQAAYLKYFGEGVLDVYRFSANKLLIYGSGDSDIDKLFESFLEWYGTWSDNEQFKLYRHLYFPTDRDYPNWVTLINIFKESYPHPSTLTPSETWEQSWNYYNFMTVDFTESGSKINLFNADPTLWINTYSCEQAMFMYYDLSTGIIGFWTPENLTLNCEIKNIALLLEKTPQEVLAIFSNWLHGTSPLYFNYVGTEVFDWPNDPWHDISYVC